MAERFRGNLDYSDTFIADMHVVHTYIPVGKGTRLPTGGGIHLTPMIDLSAGRINCGWVRRGKRSYVAVGEPIGQKVNAYRVIATVSLSRPPFL